MIKLPVLIVSRIEGLSIKPVIPPKALETNSITSGLLTPSVSAIFIFCRRLLWLAKAHALALISHSAKHAHFLIAVYRLLSNMGNIAHRRLNADADKSKTPAHHRDQNCNKRHNCYKKQCQLPVDIDQISKQTDHQTALLQQSF